MARLAYADEGALVEGDRVPASARNNMARLLAHSPGLARALSDLGTHIRQQSRLDRRYAEIATLTIGWSARAPYEWAHHITIGRAAGVTDEDIRAIRGEARPDPVTALVIRAGHEMHEGPGVGETTLDALKAHFDDESLVDLVFVMSLYCGIVRMLDSFAVDVEDDYQSVLEEFPLPA